jgi:glucose-6-phosphate-specific signal transduction histidine kinase
MAEQRRFLDPSQPQTLQGAVMLCYITAAFGLLSLLLTHDGLELFPLALGVGGYGVANERRWGYWLATVLAVLNVLYVLRVIFGGAGVFLLNLLFAVVLVALLLHPQSRHYQRIWFK